MKTWQFKLFAWLYTLLDTAISGGATAFLITVSATEGGRVDLRAMLRNALLAGLVNGVMYLRQSPLPQLFDSARSRPVPEPPKPEPGKSLWLESQVEVVDVSDPQKP